MGSIVDTRSGKLEGVTADGLHVFKGIPFAAPPVGKLRWQRPVRENAWDGVRDASQFGSQNTQGEMILNR